MQRPNSGTRQAWLVYDGAGPMCKNYARSLDVRTAIGEFHLGNVREGNR